MPTSWRLFRCARGSCGFSMVFRCGWRIARIYCRRLCCYRGTDQSYLSSTMQTCVPNRTPIFEDRRSQPRILSNRRLRYCPQQSGSTNTQRAGIGNMVITLFDVEQATRGRYVFGSTSEISSTRPTTTPADAYRGTHFQTADIEGRINLL